MEIEDEWFYEVVICSYQLFVQPFGAQIYF